MPYVKKTVRGELRNRLPENAGELNYEICQMLLRYLHFKGESYQTHCDIQGVLTGVIHEWTRRKTSPYEDKKIQENGDVF